MIRVALVTVAYFIGVALCIVITAFAAGVAVDLISNPTTFAEQEQ